MTNADFEQMFAEFGSVRSAEVIQDRDTGRSKGFGFVEMADDNAAQEAIKGLNGKEQGGRPLTVNEARPPPEERGGGGGGGGRRAAAAADMVAAAAVAVGTKRPRKNYCCPFFSSTGLPGEA